MSRPVQIIVLAAVVALLLRLVVTGDYLYYVRPGMLIALIATAVLLAGLAAFALRDAWSDADDDHDHDHHDDHGHGEPRAALLLVVPLMAVLLIAPAPLGAFSASRAAAPPPAPADADRFGPLPAGAPVDIKVVDFVQRATEGGGGTLAGRQVRMSGFVTPNPDGGWWLTRMIVGCCAADAYPARIVVRDAPALAADTWVSVTGAWVEGTGSADGSLMPQMTQSAVEVIPAPDNPYQR